MKRILALILTAILLLFSSCLTPGIMKSVTVKGIGSVRAIPDSVAFDLSFTETSDTTAQARELVNGKIKLALTVLARAGVQEKSIQTSLLIYRRKTRWNEGEEILLGQEATQTIHITMEVEGTALNDLIDQLTTIDGLGLGGLTFFLQDMTPYEQKARQIAYDEAFAKAEDYARFSQLSLGTLISLSENQPTQQLGNPLIMEAQSYSKSSSSVMTGENNITITVYAVFELR